MKLSKTLLSAIVIGIAVQAASCAKSCPKPDEKTQQAEKEKQNKQNPTPENPYAGGCPACGMG